MVEGPGSLRHIQWLVKPKIFCYNGYRKVSPYGFWENCVRNAHQGGIAMKRNRRFLSALLAAVMVGQMGVVVGLADATTGPTYCDGIDHGRTKQIATVEGCSAVVPHWIKPQKNTKALGGNGTNYFYVSPGDEIFCGNGKNIIVVKTIVATSSVNEPDESKPKPITICGFTSGKDIIYVLDDGSVAFPGTEESEETPAEEDTVQDDIEAIVSKGTNNMSFLFSGSTMSPTTADFSVKTVSAPSFQDWGNQGDQKIPQSSTPTSITLTAALKSDPVEPVYVWETKNGENWVPIDNTNSLSNTASIPANAPIGTDYQYRCTVTDVRGETVKSKEATITVTGCTKKATALKDITDLRQGILFEQDATIDLKALEDNGLLIEFTGDCNLESGHDAVRHGYSVNWELKSEVSGVKYENGKLILTADAFPENKENNNITPVTLIATLQKTGSQETLEPPIQKSYEFYVQRATETTPDPGTTTDKGDGTGTTTDKGDGTGTTTDKGDGTGTTTDKGENATNPDQSEEEQLPDNITIADVSGNKDTLKGNKVEITFNKPFTTNVEYKYSIGVNDTKYAVSWKLKEDGAPENDPLPAYIGLQDPPTGASATVVIKGTPAPGLHTFTLTATVTSATKAAQTRALLAAPAAPEQKTTRITLNITGPADPAATTCEKKPKTVNITTDPAATEKAPLHFKEEELGNTKKLLSWKYQVTEWDSGTCNDTDCNHNAAEKLIWTVETSQPNDKEKIEWVEPVNDKNEVWIICSKIPAVKDNTITITAYTKKPDNTPDQKVGKIVIPVTRDPKCVQVVEDVKIYNKVEGMDKLSVTTKSKVVGRYVEDITYQKDGVCEKGHSTGNRNDHQTPVTWKLGDIDNKNYQSGAFTLGETTGDLVVDGSKLKAGVYNVEITVTADGGKSVTRRITVTCTTATSSGSSGSSSSSSDDDDPDYSDWYQWQDIDKDICKAKKGSTVKASLKDNTDMPFYIFDDLRGEDIDLKMTVSGGYTWTVNGKTVKRLPENRVWVPLGVNKYSNKKMADLCRDTDLKSFELEHTGSFYGDMRLTVKLGTGNAKKTTYLYSYDEDKNKLTYCSSAKSDDYGNVDFVFTRSLGAYVITSKALYGESAVSTGGGAVGSGNTGSGNRPAAVYPPVAQVPASQAPAASGSTSGGSSSSSSSSSSESSSSSSEPAPPPLDPSSDPDEATPVDADLDPEPEPEKSSPVPVIVPVLILAIAGVITATVLVVRNNKGKDGFDIE